MSEPTNPTHTNSSTTPDSTAASSTAAHPTAGRRRLAATFLPVAGLSLALTACNIDIDFDEDSVTRSFDVDAFDSVAIEAPFEVSIRQGEVQSVTVEIGESREDDLVVEVIDGQLTIDVDGGPFVVASELVATVTVTDLEAITASSASDVVVAGVDVDQLDVVVDGASRIAMSGSVATMDLDLSGAANGDFDGTQIDTVTLSMSGASSADFDEGTNTIEGSIGGASSLDVDESTTLRVDSHGASDIDRN